MKTRQSTLPFPFFLLLGSGFVDVVVLVFCRRRTTMGRAGVHSYFLKRMNSLQLFLLIINLCCLVSSTFSSVVVSNENDLNAAISNNVTIELLANIALTAPILINGISSLIINGNGFHLDGQTQCQCLNISSSEVTLNDVVIMNGAQVLDQTPPPYA
jgi:hypothetical protein